MRLGIAEIERKADIISLTGIVDSPAPWEYEVKINFADWATILKTATSRDACDFIAEHVPVPTLTRMVGSIVKFIVLLVGYRMLRLTRLDRLSRSAIPPANTN